MKKKLRYNYELSLLTSANYAEFEFWNIMEATLEEINENSCDMSITGDFIVDRANNNFYAKKIEIIFNDSGLNKL